MPHVEVTQCPNCGGPVDPRTISQTDPRCPHCQQPLPLVADPPPAARPMAAPLSVPVTFTPARRGRAGCVSAVVILASVIGIGAAVIASVSGHSFLAASYTITTPVVAQGSGPDFYALARDSRKSTPNVLRRIDPIAHRVVWSTPSLNSDSGVTPVVIGGPSGLFAIAGTTVVALDPETGKQLWQSSISNGLATPCASSCAVVTNGHLVTLSKDGSLESFATATGAQAWSKRLDSTPRWLEAAGNLVLVDDTVNGSAAARDVIVLDAATGTSHTIAPTCAPDPEDPSLVTTVDDESDFFVTPDRTSLVVLIAGSPGCLERFSIASGALSWRVQPGQDGSPIPDSLSSNSTLITASILAWTSDKDVYAATLGDGAIHHVLSDAKNSYTFAGVAGNTLVAQAAPSYDENSPSIVGIDLTTGHQTWQVATLVRSSGDSQAVAVNGPAAMAYSCNSDRDTCTFEAINPVNGTIAGTATVQASPGQTDEVELVPAGASFDATVGWDHVVNISPSNAAVSWKWPS